MRAKQITLDHFVMFTLALALDEDDTRHILSGMQLATDTMIVTLNDADGIYG